MQQSTQQVPTCAKQDVKTSWGKTLLEKYSEDVLDAGFTAIPNIMIQVQKEIGLTKQMFWFYTVIKSFPPKKYVSLQCIQNIADVSEDTLRRYRVAFRNLVNLAGEPLVDIVVKKEQMSDGTFHTIGVQYDFTKLEEEAYWAYILMNQELDGEIITDPLFLRDEEANLRISEANLRNEEAEIRGLIKITLEDNSKDILLDSSTKETKEKDMKASPSLENRATRDGTHSVESFSPAIPLPPKVQEFCDNLLKRMGSTMKDFAQYSVDHVVDACIYTDGQWRKFPDKSYHPNYLHKLVKDYTEKGLPRKWTQTFPDTRVSIPTAVRRYTNEFPPEHDRCNWMYSCSICGSEYDAWTVDCPNCHIAIAWRKLE